MSEGGWFLFSFPYCVSGLMRMKSALVKEDIKDRNLQVNDVLPLSLETLAVTFLRGHV